MDAAQRTAARWPGWTRCWPPKASTAPTGEVWLHCYPRVLGFTFKPVSFWYCHRPDGSLRAIVVEVNNTFGERHCYLLDTPRYGAELRATKVFHVSPFCAVEGGYRFRFMLTPGMDRTVARIDYDDALGPLLRNQCQRDLGGAEPTRGAQSAVDVPCNDPGCGGAHPLAGCQTVVQTRALLSQTRTARALYYPIESKEIRMNPNTLAIPVPMPLRCHMAHPPPPAPSSSCCRVCATAA